MSAKHKTILQRMDTLVWWTNASERVQCDMTMDSNERRYYSMRWLPLMPMALGAALIFYAITTTLPYFIYGLGGAITMIASAIAINGPLGKPSIEDDEREAALRKNAFLFCMAFLAMSNIIGESFILLTIAEKGWGREHVIGLAFALFIANAAYFVSLPTLYVSWKLTTLSEDEL